MLKKMQKVIEVLHKNWSLNIISVGDMKFKERVVLQCKTDSGFFQSSVTPQFMRSTADKFETIDSHDQDKSSDTQVKVSLTLTALSLGRIPANPACNINLELNFVEVVFVGIFSNG